MDNKEKLYKYLTGKTFFVDKKVYPYDDLKIEGSFTVSKADETGIWISNFHVTYGRKAYAYPVVFGSPVSASAVTEAFAGLDEYFDTDLDTKLYTTDREGPEDIPFLLYRNGHAEVNWDYNVKEGVLRESKEDDEEMTRNLLLLQKYLGKERTISTGAHVCHYKADYISARRMGSFNFDADGTCKDIRINVVFIHLIILGGYIIMPDGTEREIDDWVIEYMDGVTGEYFEKMSKKFAEYFRDLVSYFGFDEVVIGSYRFKEK